MNHNEIEAWRARRAADMHAVLLREDGEAPEIARRFALLRDLHRRRGGRRQRGAGRAGAGRLARLLSLALPRPVDELLPAPMLREVDPWTVPHPRRR